MSGLALDGGFKRRSGTVCRSTCCSDVRMKPIGSQDEGEIKEEEGEEGGGKVHSQTRVLGVSHNSQKHGNSTRRSAAGWRYGWNSGKPMELSVKEFELLSYFIDNKGVALSRERILNNVWNYDYFGDARTIDTHVKKLRSKMGEKGDYIKTIWGMGYKFEV